MHKRVGNVRSNVAHLRRQFLSPIIIEYTLNVHAGRRSGKGQRSAALSAAGSSYPSASIIAIASVDPVLP